MARLCGNTRSSEFRIEELEGELEKEKVTATKTDERRQRG